MTRPAASLALALCAACALSTSAGCDAIRELGLGKKDGGGDAATSVAASSGSGSGTVSAARSLFGDAFEGEITMTVTDSGRAGPRTMVLGIRKPKFRIDTQGDMAPGNPMLAQGAGIIIDPPSKKAFMLMPAQKTAMVIDLVKAKALATRGVPGEPPGAGTTAPPTIEKTGTKDVIAGYECENWKVTSKSSRAEMCVAEGIKWIDLADLGMASPDVALAAVATEANRFPLRVITFNAQNVETSRMQATKIDKKALDEARFVVPPDYKLIDMSAMMGSLPGLGGKGGPPGLPRGLPPGFIPPRPKKR